MSLAFDIINDLYPLNRNFCSSDYDKAVEYIASILPCTIHTYTKEDERNGWTIPPKWDLLEARIEKDGKVIYDALDHPLKVIGLSTPFEGEISLEELKKHLHYQTERCDDPTAIPYHFSQSYRPWQRDWGFCVPRTLFESLEEGTYKVVISTKEEDGYLRIVDCFKQGERDEEFVFVAHLDHPGMANDDLAGCAVGIELFQNLLKQKTKFSYRLLLTQEIIGSEFYLGHLEEDKRKNILGSLFMDTLGCGPLGLQKSFYPGSLIESILLPYLQEKHPSVQIEPFKGLIGNNDEVVFESYGIAMPSLVRWPYDQYHTNLDTPRIITEEALKKSLNVLSGMVEACEQEVIIRKTFEGLPCLSNPMYDLYAGSSVGKEARNPTLRKAMDFIPFIMRPMTVKAIADQCGCPMETLFLYLKKWEEKGLIEIL